MSDNYNGYDYGGDNNKNIDTGNFHKNNANRWVYTTNYDKKQFIFTMLLISFAVLLQFILLEKLSELLYNAWNSYFNYAFSPGSIFYKFFMSMSDDEFNNFINSISEIIIYIISFAAVFTVLVFFLRKTVAKTDIYIQNRVSFKFRLPKNTWALLILGLAIVYLCGMISNVVDYFFHFAGIEKIYYDTPLLPRTWYGFLLYFISLILTPAFFEETFCRFLILNSLRKYGNGFAIITSAVFFGMLHGRTDAFLYATAIGLYSAYIAVKTKSVWFSIILHAFVNAMTIVWGYISELKILPSDKIDMIYLLFSGAIFTFSVVYLIIAIITKKKNLGLTKHRNYVYIRKSRKILLFFNIATLIFLCLAIYQASQEYKIKPGGTNFPGTSQSLSVKIPARHCGLQGFDYDI